MPRCRAGARSSWDRAKKSSSDCNFRLNLLCLALVTFAPLIASSILATNVLSAGQDVELRAWPFFLLLIVVSMAPMGLGLLLLLLYLLYLPFSLLSTVLQACINPATFQDGAHAHVEVVVNVGGNEHDSDHVLPTLSRVENSQSGETSIPVAIAVDLGEWATKLPCHNTLCLTALLRAVREASRGRGHGGRPGDVRGVRRRVRAERGGQGRGGGRDTLTL